MKHFKKNKSIKIFILFVFFWSSLCGAENIPYHNIADFGAVPDGVTKNTDTFKRAIDSVRRAGGGTVYVPPGEYLTGPIHFVDNMTLYIEAGATIKFTTDFDDYYPMVQVRFQGIDFKNFSPLIYAYQVNNISIKGKGKIDGQGQAWNDFFRKFRQEFNESGGTNTKINKWQEETYRANHPAIPEHGGFMRPQLLLFYDCDNVSLEDVSIFNSPFWSTHFVLCENVNVRGVYIKNPPSVNPDGINPESCKNVHISHCHIDTDDDCITIKAGKNKEARWEGNSCENITITNCTMISGSAAVGIGSEMSGGVRNVTVSNCVFDGTNEGIYIKTMRGRGGVVEDITVDNIIIKNSKNGAAIDVNMLYWRPTEKQPVSEDTPKFRNLSFSNIRGTGNKQAIRITGLEEMAIENVSFSNIDLGATSGASFEHVRNLRLNNVTITPDTGSVVSAIDVNDVEIKGLSTRKMIDNDPLVQLKNSGNVYIRDLFLPDGFNNLLELSGEETNNIHLDEADFSRGANVIRYKNGANSKMLVK
ncbi:MAG: glycoside hydrolase family 28 protein [Bacteroidales bacterium]|nr:glycoside hydrolase family 28 protein [Bacteroidales bacterium]